MHVAKWGNSLAVRVPADVARELGLKEGDKIDLVALDREQVGIITERQRREAMVERIKQMAVRLPADYKFDRDEANAR